MDDFRSVLNTEWGGIQGRLLRVLRDVFLLIFSL